MAIKPTDKDGRFQMSDIPAFLKDNWESILAVFTIAHVLLSGREPSDHSKVAKAIHGGLFKNDDEIALFESLLKVGVNKDDLKEVEGFLDWVRISHGQNVLGRLLHTINQNRFRTLLSQMREHSKTIKVDGTDAKGKPVVRHEPNPIDTSVLFLKDMAERIRTARTNYMTTGMTEAEATTAAYNALLEHFSNIGVPRPALLGALKKIDRLFDTAELVIARAPELKQAILDREAQNRKDNRARGRIIGWIMNHI